MAQVQQSYVNALAPSMKGGEGMEWGTKALLSRHGLIGGGLRHTLAAAGMSGAGGEIGYALSTVGSMG